MSPSFPLGRYSLALEVLLQLEFSTRGMEFFNTVESCVEKIHEYSKKGLTDWRVFQWEKGQWVCKFFDGRKYW